MFFLIALVPIAGVHAYLWWRLVAGPFHRRWVRVAGAAVLLALVASAVFGLHVSGLLPNWLGQALGWVGALWLATLFYLLIALVVLEPVRALASRGEPSSVDRRLFLARATALTAGFAALGTVGYGATEARHVRIKRVPISLPALDPKLDGYRIALLTDIHLSETLRRPFLEHTVQTVNSLGVDLVAIVGDLVDGTVDELGDQASALSGLRAANGTYFVTGNHEYYSGAEEWVEFLPTLGVKVLRNQRLEVGKGGAGFDLAGIDDATAAKSGVPGHGANLAKALEGRSDDQPVVLLAHQPVQWPEAVRRGVDLQLSGHTHGGQLWPFNYAVRLQQPVVAGWAKDGDSQIYVSRGVGYWGPPVRVGAPPEISLITLRAGGGRLK
jgi:predicted MPP superfamily phosphohydrolase